jgi:hypothetical protein
MKKIGTTALAVLTALSMTAFCVSCGKKKEEPKPANPPANQPEKPAGGGH